MRMTNQDAWVLARIMSGRSVGGRVEGISAGFRGLAARLQSSGPDHRQTLLAGFAEAQPDPEALLRAIMAAGADSDEPPADEPPDRVTLEGVGRLESDRTWPWPGWLPNGALTAMAADPGIGKTLLAMTLSRCLWLGLPWPDGHPPSFPAGTPTLWIPGDHHFNQLIEVAEAYGIPRSAVLLNGTSDDPTGRMFLDDPEVIEALHANVARDRPGLVIVDTVGMTTDRNLGRPDEARQYFEPLMKIAGQTRTSFLLLTHLSKESQALGRRIVGASRVVWKLTQPDADGQPDRRKLWVDKSYALKPPALGMTIAADGCTFDGQPPAEASPNQGGRPDVKRGLCRAWLKGRLDSGPVRISEIRAEGLGAGFDPKMLYAARDAIKAEQIVHEGRKCWRLADAS
jgi:hypothetical protein